MPSPNLNKAFVMGPGYAPVTYKLVTKITAGLFLDLAGLLPDNIRTQEIEPQAFLEGKSLYSVQTTLSTQRIKPNFCISLPNTATPQFLSLEAKPFLQNQCSFGTLRTSQSLNIPCVISFSLNVRIIAAPVFSLRLAFLTLI